MKISNFKVLVLGSTGLLGSTLSPFLSSRGHLVITHGRSAEAQYKTDFSDHDNAHQLLENVKPEVIVNLVGLTDVDNCETNPNQAYLTNVRVVENITDWIKHKKTKCHLVHISSDQIYDGLGPHLESDVTLTNYYAFSKYAGELSAKTIPSTILRTNFIGRSHCVKRTSLSDWLFSALSNNRQIQVFEDVLFSPMSTTSLTAMIELCIQMQPIGVFNLGSQGGMSKADFAFAFAKEINLSTTTISRTKTNQVSFLKTYRPKDMRLDSSKFENTLGIKLPELSNLIQQIAHEYK